MTPRLRPTERMKDYGQAASYHTAVRAVSAKLTVQAWNIVCSPEYKLALLAIAEQASGNDEEQLWYFRQESFLALTCMPVHFVNQILQTLEDEGLLASIPDSWGERQDWTYRVDFSPWLESQPADESPVAHDVPDPGRTAERGYVYVLEAGGYYKIGRTRAPDSRIKQLRIQLPFPVEVVCVIPSDDYIRLEDELHERFADKRANGEWFSLANDDVSFLVYTNHDERMGA